MKNNYQSINKLPINYRESSLNVKKLDEIKLKIYMFYCHSCCIPVFRICVEKCPLIIQSAIEKVKKIGMSSEG